MLTSPRTDIIQPGVTDPLSVACITGASIPSCVLKPVKDPFSIRILSARKKDHSELLGHFQIELCNASGNRLETRVFSYELGHPSPHTIALQYRVEMGRLKIALESQYFPGLVARPQNLDLMNTLKSKGTLLTLPESSLQADDKVLGHSMVLSSGSSAKVITLYARELGSQQPAELFDAQEYLHNYFSVNHGSQSLSALLGILRLSAELGIPVCVSYVLPQPTCNVNPTDSLIPLIHGEELRERVIKSPEKRANPIHAVKITQARPPERAFLTPYEINYQLLDAQGMVADESTIEMIGRPHLDSVDCAAYFWSNGELYMIVKRGIRPGLFIHDVGPQGIEIDTNQFTIEGIAESLEGETSLSAIQSRAIAGVHEEAGVEIQRQPEFLGFSYPAPHRHFERVYNFAVEADPTRKSSEECDIDERVDLFAAPVREIVALCKEGLIFDPRLELNARILEIAARK